ncbi:hypothetical protein SRB5_08850 [Streptomyces sp. RB5]|uniref:Uncharacterized protein n=1 Tax=Streptomyces smaragdinus TaxID=2585196 RepID=A0A7K0CCD4_9ACTN|nr:hypothetical protein [Streptomyces smaragdinus]
MSCAASRNVRRGRPVPGRRRSGSGRVKPPPGMSPDPERTGLAFLASLQGVTGLANCGVVTDARLEDLLADVVARLARP